MSRCPISGRRIAFVLVIALLNVVTQVDHIFVLTKGGPSELDQPPAVLRLPAGGRALRRRQGAGRDRSSRWRSCSRSRRCRSRRDGAASAASERAPRTIARPARSRRKPRLRARSLAIIAALWVMPVPLDAGRGLPAGTLRRLRHGLARSRTTCRRFANFREAWASADFPRYYLNTAIDLRRHPRRADRHHVARRLRLRAAANFPAGRSASTSSCIQLMLVPIVLLVPNLAHDRATRPLRHAARRDGALFRLRLRHLPDAPGLPQRSRASSRTPR